MPDPLPDQLRTKHTKPYKCTVCSYSSSRRRDLIRHLRRHTGEKPYKCKVCPYESGDLSGYHKHVKRKHNGYKSFNCSVCDQSFLTRSQLEQHFRLHSIYHVDDPVNIDGYDASGFKLETNDQKTPLFSDSPAVMIAKDDRTEPLQCDVCNTRFDTELKLGRHLWEVHVGGIEHNDTVASQSCAAPPLNENKHLDGAVLPDQDSQYVVSTISARSLVHRKSPPKADAVVCTICGSSVNRKKLSMHLKIHTGEKLHKCGFCEYASYKKFNVERHLRRCHTGNKRHTM